MRQIYNSAHKRPKQESFVEALIGAIIVVLGPLILLYL